MPSETFANGGNYDKQVSNNNGQCLNFDHLTWWVGNAKQAAHYFCVQFGFQKWAYKGLETGSREVAAHVVRQKDIFFVFASPLLPGNNEMGAHLVQHGDGVKDIAFTVDDIDLVMERAKLRGAKVVKDIWTEEDEFGSARMATISTFGDTSHTFVQRSNYKGAFLPGFRRCEEQIPLLQTLAPARLEFIDHCVGTQTDQMMENQLDWYQRSLAFHRFWSIDDVSIETEFSALRFVVVANNTETIKINILEPAVGKRKSQVQEYLEYYGGPGIQHIALHTDNIIESIMALRGRGVEFLNTPKQYYQKLREKLKLSKVKITEDIAVLEQLKILLDYDDNGYLLQIFTKPLQDRPTVFLEIIQRHNFGGFGAGNFRTLFEAVELEQAERGNLL